MKPSSLFDLSGRVALVTGASQGIGLAIAEGLAEAGARVVLVARRTGPLEKAAEAMRTSGLQAEVVAADVTDEGAVREMAARALERCGRVDVLVNNAGIAGEGAVLDMDVAQWDRVLSVNLRAAMVCAKHLGRGMVERGSGSIINVASVYAFRVARYLSSYSASKAALVQLTRSLALEWVRHGVRVNALCPGYFATPMNEEFFASPAGQRVCASLPMQRIGAPHEIKGAAVFLASDAASFVTGASLLVDGGHALV